MPTSSVPARFVELLQILARETGLEDLTPLDEEPDLQVITFDQLEVMIIWHEPTQCVRLNAELGPADALTRDQLWLMLDANCFWAGTNGASLALDQGSSRVFLQDRMPIERLDDATFLSWLPAFVQTAESWANQVVDGED